MEATEKVYYKPRNAGLRFAFLVLIIEIPTKRPANEFDSIYFFPKILTFSSSSGLLIVLHQPSGDEIFFVDYPLLRYIKGCVFECKLQI